MIDDIASFDGRIAKVQGPARSGKTEALVRRAGRLVRAGVDPTSILVETTNGFAAQAFRQRLAVALDDEFAQEAARVRVCTALDACVEVLDAPAARAHTGRVPRILTAAEYNFLLEDMKTLGAPIRKLRRMLAYFYQQMDNLEPRSSWRIGGEEEAVLGHLTSTLAARGAMLAQEAPELAVEFLKSEAGAASRAAYAYVLCDDFQNLSRAQQTCLCLLADSQLIVTGNPNQTVEVATEHPDPHGFAQFHAVRRNVETFALEGAFGDLAITAFVDALCDHGDMDPAFKAGRAAKTAAGALEAVKWSSPEDELNGLTKYLRSIIDEEEDPHESRTCVLVPNKRWATMAATMLRKRGFDVSTAGSMTGLGGDPRESARARGLVAYTKLALLADPHDMTAWRSWCGFDNYLTNSDAWASLMSYADEQGLSLYDALAAVAEAEAEPFLRAGVLAERWQEGQDFIAKNAARRGFSLMRAVGGTELPEFEAVNAELVGDEDAEAVYRLVRRTVTEPVWPENPHVLHVATYDALCGAEYDRILVMGAVDGFVPSRDAFEVISTEEAREEVMNRERRRFANAVSKANEHLVISFFSKADLELAERSKMQVARVKSEDGKRVAVLRPSSLLAEAGNAAPATSGGQNLLAERGLN